MSRGGLYMSFFMWTLGLVRCHFQIPNTLGEELGWRGFLLPNLSTSNWFHIRAACREDPPCPKRGDRIGRPQVSFSRVQRTASQIEFNTSHFEVVDSYAFWQAIQGGSNTEQSHVCDGGRRSRAGVVYAAVEAAVSLHSGQEFHERSERDGVLQRRISPFLSVQPARTGVGTHELGTCGEHRHGALERAGRGDSGRRQLHDLFRQRSGGLE